MTDIAIDASVIICAYTEERWRHLVAAVESIQQQMVPPREIIVVIDHNKRLLERAQKHLPGVVVIENIEVQGLSGARNSGIAVAQGALIAFLDDDAVAQPDWLAWLSQCCVDAQVLGAGGRVEPLWEGKQPVWFPEEFYWVIGCSYRGLPEVQAVVRNPYGGCTCYRREVFELVGGFRNEIGRVGARPLGGEETELCIRAKHQWPQKIFLCEPRARIGHCVSAYRASWRYFLSRCYAEGLSKALVARYVGIRDGLASERAYTLRTLPLAVLHGLADALFRWDLMGLARAGAIITGLALTTAGYLVGRIVPWRTRVKKINAKVEVSGSHCEQLLPVAAEPRDSGAV